MTGQATVVTTRNRRGGAARLPQSQSRTEPFPPRSRTSCGNRQITRRRCEKRKSDDVRWSHGARVGQKMRMMFRFPVACRWGEKRNVERFCCVDTVKKGMRRRRSGGGKRVNQEKKNNRPLLSREREREEEEQKQKTELITSCRPFLIASGEWTETPGRVVLPSPLYVCVPVFSARHTF